MQRGRLIVYAGVVMALAALCTAGCGLPRVVVGSGRVVEESRPVGGFSGVELECPGELFIEQGQEELLRVEAEDNLLPYLATEVGDGVLRIYVRGNVGMNTSQAIRFYLTATELDRIIVSNPANVTVSALDAAQLTIRIRDAGQVQLAALTADRLVVQFDGLGNLTILSGEVQEQEVSMQGGVYEAGGLQSARASATLKGVSAATIRVSEHLRVDIQGGTVQYLGNPTVEQNVTGLGQLRRIGD